MTGEWIRKKAKQAKEKLAVSRRFERLKSGEELPIVLGPFLWGYLIGVLLVKHAWFFLSFSAAGAAVSVWSSLKISRAQRRRLDQLLEQGQRMAEFFDALAAAESGTVYVRTPDGSGHTLHIFRDEDEAPPQTAQFKIN